MAGEEQSAEREQEFVTVESVEGLIEMGLETGDDIELYGEQHDSVMKLWSVACRQTGEAQELAIWGLGEIARDQKNRGIGSLALDRLDRISKEAPPGSEPQQLARQAVRRVLKATQR